MSDTPPSRRMVRSIGAVFAGVLTIVVLSTVTDMVMHGTGVFPPVGQPMSDALFVLATAYRLVYGVAGGYVTARLAPARPLRHALALGVVGLIVSAAGTAATWNKGPEFGPKWYPLGLVVTAIPCTWVGGRAFVRAVTNG